MYLNEKKTYKISVDLLLLVGISKVPPYTEIHQKQRSIGASTNILASYVLIWTIFWKKIYSK